MRSLLLDATALDALLELAEGAEISRQTSPGTMTVAGGTLELVPEGSAPRSIPLAFP